MTQKPIGVTLSKGVFLNDRVEGYRQRIASFDSLLSEGASKSVAQDDPIADHRHPEGLVSSRREESKGVGSE